MLRGFLFLFTFFTFAQSAFTQTTYNMSNASISDCQGTLLDSEGGTNGTTYANNENYIFTICSGGTIRISWNSQFCVDSGFDWLKVYAGPDTNSTLIGAYTGYTAPPNLVVAGGCVTFHFTSDANAAYCGWELDWTTDKIPPIPPTMSVNPAPSCSTSQLTLSFSGWIPCDSIDPGDFIITGPVNNILVNTITSSLNCQNAGDTTNTLTLYLNKSLNRNCTYNIDFELGLPDNCDSIWYFNLLDSFLIDDCPFTVDIQASLDTICAGLCTDLLAVVSGNGPNCLSYNYTWNNGLPNSAGTHTVCPTGTLNYTVVVQSTTGGPSVAAQKTIVFVDPQITDSDTTVCQSDSAFTISVSQSGGRFWGNGIIDAISGIFHPDSAGPGNHYIKYGFTNFCEDSILIQVTAIDAGLAEAACPGAPPFLLSGFSPGGGIWSGDSVTTSGFFNPALPGTYVLTYAVNGCTEDKVVSVDSISLAIPIDTVCKSDTAFIIPVSPPGGRWTGSGITDTVLGWFDPSIAGAGTYTLVYKLSGVGNSGCSFNIDITVNEIDAYWNLVACPDQPPFTLYPAGIPSGGSWSGRGITNATSGTYSPGQGHSGGTWSNDTLTYTASNGCSDTRIVYLRYTRVYDDTVFFCLSDTALYLDWYGVRRTPGGGVWTGNGLTNTGSRYYFHPSIAGAGTHTLVYTANTCYDSVVMVVYPENIKKYPFNYLWPDTTVCSTHPAWNFPPMPAGGSWVGQGITNGQSGYYDPSVAGTGTHIVKYVSPNGCVDDSVLVTVYPFVPAQILNLDTAYCYKDTLIPITLKPKNGQLTGPGIVNGTFFNPALAGEGQHRLTYSFGNGFCETNTSLDISISKELIGELSAGDTLLCPYESTTLEVNTEGGASGTNYTFTWSHGLFPVASHNVSPTSSTWYSVVMSDGCSDPVKDSVFIEVAPPVKPKVETSEKLCFGADGYAQVLLDSIWNYTISWDTDPEQVTDSLEGLAGSSYPVTILNNATGCSLDTLIKIPSFKNIVANFSTSPNFDCIPSDQKEVTFLDLSQNADSGTWDIAGMVQYDYVLGQNPKYTFTEAGFYSVTLTVFNEGGCRDEYEVNLCIEDIRPVFVADAFTPNGDGVNDVLHVKAKGIKELSFRIYDRWGNLVFESSNQNDGWDGNFRGQKANAGVYLWVVEVKLINNDRNVIKGNVTLVR